MSDNDFFTKNKLGVQCVQIWRNNAWQNVFHEVHSIAASWVRIPLFCQILLKWTMCIIQYSSRSMEYTVFFKCFTKFLPGWGQKMPLIFVKLNHFPPDEAKTSWKMLGIQSYLYNVSNISSIIPGTLLVHR